MGKFAESEFGKKNFGKVGIIVAGTSNKEREKKILSYFDKIISYKDRVQHAYLARKGKIDYPVVFNVYGAPAVMDVLAVLHDGGCKNVIFVGFAYGFERTKVGDIIIPDRAYHFDGIYSIFEKSHFLTFPDKKLLRKIETVLQNEKIAYTKGKNISVPAVSFQLPHANKRYKKIKPLTLEMELAACFSRAKDLGIRATGILIISDTKKASIIDKSKKEIRNISKINVIKTIISRIERLNLPRLKREKEFRLDEHLASIIEDGTGINIYSQK